MQPLLDVDEIKERQDMVEEMMNSDAPILNKVKIILYRLPDFERALTTVFHKKVIEVYGFIRFLQVGLCGMVYTVKEL